MAYVYQLALATWKDENIKDVYKYGVCSMCVRSKDRNGYNIKNRNDH